jgi:hypothetical protein
MVVYLEGQNHTAAVLTNDLIGREVLIKIMYAEDQSGNPINVDSMSEIQGVVLHVNAPIHQFELLVPSTFVFKPKSSWGRVAFGNHTVTPLPDPPTPWYENRWLWVGAGVFFIILLVLLIFFLIRRK